MQKTYNDPLLKKLPLAYSYHKILLDQSGKPVDFVLLDINKSYEQIMGVAAENVIGKKASEIFTDLQNDAFDWIGFYGNVALTGISKEMTRYAQYDNQWYKVTAYSPAKHYFAVIFQNVTEDRRNLEEVKKQAKEINELSGDLEMIFNNTQEAMFLVSVEGEEFRYIRFNKSYEKHAGVNLEETKGKTPTEVLGKEVGELVLADYKRCVQKREKITYEQTLRTASGPRTWMTSLTPVMSDGVVKYLIGSRMDFTELKKARDENERLLHWLQTMFNAHSAIMLMIEPESGSIMDANPSACAYYGYSKDELLLMNNADINIALQENEATENLQTKQKGERYIAYKSRLKNGETRLVDAYICPITYADMTQNFAILFDSTDREKYKEQLRHEKELLEIMLDSIGDGVVGIDNNGYITEINKAAQEITGWKEDEVRNKPFMDVFQLRNEETGMPIEDPVERVLKSGNTIGIANHTVLMNKEGRNIPISGSAAPIKDENGRTYGVVIIFRDVSKEKEHLQQILYLSFHDTLTGLYNRRFMEEEMMRIDVPRQLPLTVIMGDVNGLKITNDVFGHETGDRLLKGTAEAFKEVCRREDIASRWGGDEFLMILPKTGFADAQKIVQRIRRNCSGKRVGELRLSVSLGFAVKLAEEEDLERIIQKAEEEMYHQKLMESKGLKNRIIKTLMATLYEKSAETKEHTERLWQHCLMLGKALHLPDAVMNKLHSLALLHDIGKAVIGRGILLKSEPLTDEDWTEIRRHPEIGYRIATNVPEMSNISELILSHHERWDGKGYPRGLKAEAIPLPCRILAVADAYDALTTERVYGKKALSHEEAISELKQNAGTQFDAVITDLFIKLIGSKKP